LLVTLLHLGRQRETPAWQSLWAEDASVFLTDGYRDAWGTFFEQNGGYLHVVPRLVGAIAALLPLDDAALVFAFAGSVVVALVAAFVYAASGDVLHTRGLRLGLAATVAFLPVAGAELYANVLNLHFYLVFACFWALTWQATTASAVLARSLVVVAATLSDPVSGLLAPLALVGPTVRRGRAALIVSGCFALGLAIQLTAMRGGESPERNWAFHAWDVPDILALRVGGGLLVGDRFLDDLWLWLGRAFSVTVLALVLAVVGLLLVRSRRRQAVFALVSLIYAAVFLVVHLVGRGTGGMDPDAGSFHLEGARYALLPFLFLLTALLVLIDGSRWPWANWARVVALIWLVGLLAANYAVGPNARSSGPLWQREVEEASQRCQERSSATVRILAAPAPPNVWYARVPCSRASDQG
jgi:multisubunit Na+/H+ antiporter MnhC subunit